MTPHCSGDIRHEQGLMTALVQILELEASAAQGRARAEILEARLSEATADSLVGKCPPVHSISHTPIHSKEGFRSPRTYSRGKP